MAEKLLYSTLIFVIVFAIAWFVTSRLSLKLDFSQVFKADVQSPPQPSFGGISVVLNGVDGDHAVVGFTSPIASSSPTGSENLLVEQKNLTEIIASLDKIEAEQWEFLTNLSSSVFRFDVILDSYSNSPNNAKKASYYIVTDQNGAEYKVLPGESITLVHGFKISDLASALSKVKIKLAYGNGLYQNFYDQNGKLVSQATGAIHIKPTLFAQFLTILGVWAFLVAILLLIKQTLMFSKDVEEIVNFFRGQP